MALSRDQGLRRECVSRDRSGNERTADRVHASRLRGMLAAGAGVRAPPGHAHEDVRQAPKSDGSRGRDTQDPCGLDRDRATDGRPRDRSSRVPDQALARRAARGGESWLGAESRRRQARQQAIAEPIGLTRRWSAGGPETSRRAPASTGTGRGEHAQLRRAAPGVEQAQDLASRLGVPRSRPRAIEGITSGRDQWPPAPARRVEEAGTGAIRATRGQVANAVGSRRGAGPRTVKHREPSVSPPDPVTSDSACPRGMAGSGSKKRCRARQGRTVRISRSAPVGSPAEQARPLSKQRNGPPRRPEERGGRRRAPSRQRPGHFVHCSRHLRTAWPRTASPGLHRGPSGSGQAR